MSRIGKLPVPIPAGVKCELNGRHFKVTGPKGTLERTLSDKVSVSIEDDEVIRVTRPDDYRESRAHHGLTRSLVNNMVQGVSQGFERTLQISGVGYRASMQGNTLHLTVGYSHPVSIEPPEGITFAVEGAQTIKVSGYDKEKVGRMAAYVRSWRKPEPYKGKGIHYAGEQLRRKVGKAGGK
ncbi:MAG: 50S ribosomal protein L6 [Candidatus Hydrogenedentota bacterium]